jgi:23S rRNA (cytosine1962-C5)-methyltransferase
VSEADFAQLLAEAAQDVHRTVRLLEKRSQAKDHPAVISIPETSYLKAMIINVIN